MTKTESRQEKIYSIISKLFVWGLFFGILFLLRSFFLLIFLTFIFSYIQAGGIEKLNKSIKNRTLCVVLVCFSFFTILVCAGSYLIPRVIDQAKIFADRHESYFTSLDREIVKGIKRYPVLGKMLSDQEKAQLENINIETHVNERPLSMSMLQSLLGFGKKYNPEQNVRKAVTIVRNIGQPLFAFISAFLLSLLFSFLILLDLERLKKSMMNLTHTKLGFVYDEVAPSIRDFARVVGSAFEAQSLIALFNTVLTAGVIYILGVQKSIAFLCLIVFFCSFIPVAGVFLSSVPICLLALQKSGFTGLVLGGLMIWGVHVVEAYILNPKIYGEKLKINPVLVLIILTISGKLFNVWGLLLSLPIYTYVFGHAIKEESS